MNIDKQDLFRDNLVFSVSRPNFIIPAHGTDTVHVFQTQQCSYPQSSYFYKHSALNENKLNECIKSRRNSNKLWNRETKQKRLKNF